MFGLLVDGFMKIGSFATMGWVFEFGLWVCIDAVCPYIPHPVLESGRCRFSR
jgi:hypothetical protein